jgi:hypothetical protein
MYQVHMSTSAAPNHIVKWLFPSDTGCGDRLPNYQAIGHAEIVIRHRGYHD